MVYRKLGGQFTLASGVRPMVLSLLFCISQGRECLFICDGTCSTVTGTAPNHLEWSPLVDSSS